MKNTSLLFATARVKANEKNLLSNDRLIRLLDCSDLSEASKLLQEFGYGGGVIIDDPYRYGEVLAAERVLVDKLIDEILPEGSAMCAMFIERDCHNAKVVAKCKYFGAATDTELSMTPYEVSFDTLLLAVGSGVYDTLPAYLAEAFRSLDTIAEGGTLRPSQVDIAFDVAEAKAVAARLKHQRDGATMRKYFEVKRDTTNILTYMRALKIGMTGEDFSARVLSGGSISQSTLVAAYAEGANGLVAITKNTAYEKLAQTAVSEMAEPAFVRSETMSDDMQHGILREERDNMFTVACIANYYLSKVQEIKQVRIILTGIKNGIDVAAIKKRLRNIYA